MARTEARPDAEQLTDANALRGVYRAVALVALAVLCMVVPRVLAAAFFDGEYDQHPPPILTRELAVWLALCPLAVIAGFRARPLIRDKVMASGAVLIALTALLAFFWGMAEAVFLAAVFCIGVLFPRDVRVTPSLAVEVAGEAALLTAVAGAWLLLAFYLAIGAIVFPTGASDQYTQYEGIELALFPLAAVVGFRSTRFLERAHWLPLAATVGLAALIVVAGWSWSLQAVPLWAERWPAAILIAITGYAGAVLYPRLTATMAGAVGLPALVLGLPFLVSLDHQVNHVLANDGAWTTFFAMKTLGALALLAFAPAFSGLPRYGLCSGAVMLFLVESAPLVWVILGPLP